MIKTVYPAGAGTLNSAAAAFNSVRFIPAGAGTPKTYLATSVFPVYPLAREHTSLHAGNPADCGLSPLARGTLYRMMCGDYSTGLSRWRGNTLIRIQHISRPIGLSPLAREHAIGRKRFLLLLRFIPAGAGTLSLLNLGFDYWRFIPAGAGTPPAPVSISPAVGLSPLAREHSGSFSRPLLHAGLSPLAREHGLLTTSTALSVGLSRWRGEHASSPLLHCTQGGLSAGAGTRSLTQAG